MTWKCSTVRTDLMLVQFRNHRTYGRESLVSKAMSYKYSGEV